MIPFRMKRVPKKLKIPGTANMKTHWVVTLEIAASTEEIRRVISGEILYLGQRRGKKYELETTGPAEGREDKVIVEPETEEEAETREAKEAEEKENTKKEIEESRAREAQLKKDHEEGKDKLKSYQEAKAIHKEKVKEETKILLAISKQAQKAGIDSFEKLIKFAVDMGIFPTMLSEHLARKVLTSNTDKYNQLMKALEQPTEGDKEKLDKIFERFNKAGLDTWREIAYFACLADLKEPGSPLEELKRTLIDNPEAVDKIIRLAKIREEEEGEQ